MNHKHGHSIKAIFIHQVILAAGEKENNYTLDLIVRVRDVYGAVNDTTFKIKVFFELMYIW